MNQRRRGSERRAGDGRKVESGKWTGARQEATALLGCCCVLSAPASPSTGARSSAQRRSVRRAVHAAYILARRPSPVAPSGLRDAGIECVARRCHNSPSRSAPALIEPYCRHFSWRAAGMVAAVHPCC